MHHPGEGFGYPRRMSYARASGPKHERLVAVTDVTNMLGLVLGDGGFRVRESDALANLFDVAGVASEETPAGTGVPRIAVGSDCVEVIFFRLQRDRVHEDIPADLIAENLLYFRQIGRDQRTDFVALSVEEIEGDDLALDQVIVEIDLFALMRDQGDVRKILLLNSNASFLRSIISDTARAARSARAGSGDSSSGETAG